MKKWLRKHKRKLTVFYKASLGASLAMLAVHLFYSYRYFMNLLATNLVFRYAFYFSLLLQGVLLLLAALAKPSDKRDK